MYVLCVHVFQVGAYLVIVKIKVYIKVFSLDVLVFVGGSALLYYNVNEFCESLLQVEGLSGAVVIVNCV